MNTDRGMTGEMQDAAMPGGSSWGRVRPCFSCGYCKECGIPDISVLGGGRLLPERAQEAVPAVRPLEREAEFSNQEQLEAGGLYLGPDFPVMVFLGAGGVLGFLSVDIKLCSSHGYFFNIQRVRLNILGIWLEEHRRHTPGKGGKLFSSTSLQFRGRWKFFTFSSGL